jgi:hypothetical protein
MYCFVNGSDRWCAVCLYFLLEFFLKAVCHSLDDVDVVIDHSEGEGFKLPIFLHCKYIIKDDLCLW